MMVLRELYSPGYTTTENLHAHSTKGETGKTAAPHIILIFVKSISFTQMGRMPLILWPQGQKLDLSLDDVKREQNSFTNKDVVILLLTDMLERKESTC